MVNQLISPILLTSPVSFLEFLHSSPSQRSLALDLLKKKHQLMKLPLMKPPLRNATQPLKTAQLQKKRLLPLSEVIKFL